ncbi:MAG: hypothetical protein QXW45_06905 [Thermosphaera sp.]
MEEVQHIFYQNPLKNILQTYIHFIRLLKAKKPGQVIVVKAKDTCTLLDICDMESLINMGRLLKKLEEYGLAVRINDSRPPRYMLDGVFNKIREICRLDGKGEEFCIESGCSLLGICPYWKLRQRGETVESEHH